jgi:hypothetical protein
MSPESNALRITAVMAAVSVAAGVVTFAYTDIAAVMAIPNQPMSAVPVVTLPQRLPQPIALPGPAVSVPPLAPSVPAGPGPAIQQPSVPAKTPSALPTAPATGVPAPVNPPPAQSPPPQPPPLQPQPCPIGLVLDPVLGVCVRL